MQLRHMVSADSFTLTLASRRAPCALYMHPMQSVNYISRLKVALKEKAKTKKEKLGLICFFRSHDANRFCWAKAISRRQEKLNANNPMKKYV